MKKFIVMILSVTTFFLGLGSLVGEVSAKFKSDERALELIRQARQAIGGDANIKNVRSLTITGRAIQTFNADGVQRSEQGDLEINLSLPNQYGKLMKFGDETGEGLLRKEADVLVFNKSADKELLEVSPNEPKVRVFERKLGDGEKVVAPGDDEVILDKIVRAERGGFRQNELFRTTLSLLLTSPEGLDVNYVYAGEGNVDGFLCDIVDAQSNGSSIKLYLDKSSHLPRMVAYQAVKPFMIKITKEALKPEGEDKETKTFLIQKMQEPETAEFQLRFSDYRTVNGVQLPFKWTQTVAGQADQNVDIVSYEINPANIADKFKEQKVFLRTKKPQ